MSELDDYTKDKFTPEPATRRLIEKVRREASLPADRGQLGAWLFTFARLGVMNPDVLEIRGCPPSQVAPLLAFAMDLAIQIAAPIVRRTGSGDTEMLRQTSEYIARISRLRWGTEAADEAESAWISAGTGHITLEFRNDPRMGSDRARRAAAVQWQ